MDLGFVVLLGATPDGAARTVQLERRAAGAYDGATGEFTQGAATTSDLVAVVRRATARSLQRLPEGQRTAEAIEVLTRERLFTARPEGSFAADVVIWDGARWQVEVVDDDTVSGHGTCRAVARRIGAT